MDNIKYLTGLTNTGAAITEMVNVGFSAARGARLNDPNVAQVAVIITDGRSTDFVGNAAKLLRARNIKTFAIGVTPRINDKQLDELTGDSLR